MGGRGTRLRPHTLTTPKPLIEIAGKSIVQRIVDLIKKSQSRITNVGFIIEKPDLLVEEMLKKIGSENNIGTSIFFQTRPEGTAHAIYCAKKMLKGPIMVVFADTLFEAELKFPNDADGCIFVKEVDDPSAYGVVKLNTNGYITDFIEKPEEPVSNLAIVGMYYFKDGELLKKEIKKILANNTKVRGEYQITTVLQYLKEQNKLFLPVTIKNWYDCGSPTNILDSHAKILDKEFSKNEKFKNTQIIPPCFIAEGVKISDSTIGPHVSIGKGTIIKSSILKNTIIQNKCLIRGAVFSDSIIGNKVEYNKDFKNVSIGDYSTFK